MGASESTASLLPDSNEGVKKHISIEMTELAKLVCWDAVEPIVWKKPWFVKSIPENES